MYSVHLFLKETDTAGCVCHSICEVSSVPALRLPQTSHPKPPVWPPMTPGSPHCMPSLQHNPHKSSVRYVITAQNVVCNKQFDLAC